MSPSSSIPLVLLAAAVAIPAAMAKQVPAGAIAAPMIRNKGQTAYYAEVLVGTPPQKNFLKVDSGSPRYAFLSPDNEVCTRPGQLCKTFGTFNNITSSTSHYEDSGFQDALISYGMGDFLNDTISLGGVSMEDMYFGYTLSYAFPRRAPLPPATIMGLSLECDRNASECNSKGPYLLPQLKKASSINRMATSFYLGPDDANVTNAQLILGAAYDKAKVGGDMFTVNMVDPFHLGQTNSANVTALEVVVDGESTSQTYGEPGFGVPVLLDTGVASWYLPQSMFEVVFKALGGTGKGSSSQPYQVVDCKYRDPENVKGYVSVEFGSAGKIQIPLHTLVSRAADGTCQAFIFGRGEELTAFGDPFLRGVYIIFDQESFTISMSQVKHTDEEDLVPFPEGGFKATS